MKVPIKVLVTAVGGDLGQAIVKALRVSSFPLDIHGCDLDTHSYAAAFVQAYHAVPAACHPDYVKELEALCETFALRAVVPSSEPELMVLEGRCLPSGVPVVSQPIEVLRVYGDKLATMRALADTVKLAAFADGADTAAVHDLIDRCGFPVVVKPRRSSGSRNVRLATCLGELESALGKVPMPLVQEYLDDSGGEFSVGVFRTTDFESAVAFKRRLSATAGISWQAELVENPEVCAYALEIGRVASATGSLNVQLRLTSAGPRLLEVNPRFSSLVAARAACGFRDAEWSLVSALHLPMMPPRGPYKRLRFWRFYHEVVDLGDGCGVLPEWLPRPVPCGLTGKG